MSRALQNRPDHLARRLRLLEMRRISRTFAASSEASGAGGLDRWIFGSSTWRPFGLDRSCLSPVKTAELAQSRPGPSTAGSTYAKAQAEARTRLRGQAIFEALRTANRIASTRTKLAAAHEFSPPVDLVPRHSTNH